MIEQYFWSGFKYPAIIRSLELYHGIMMTKRTLLRRLKDYGLSRRSQSSPLLDLWNAVTTELQGPGGYTYCS